MNAGEKATTGRAGSDPVAGLRVTVISPGVAIARGSVGDLLHAQGRRTVLLLTGGSATRDAVTTMPRAFLVTTPSTSLQVVDETVTRAVVLDPDLVTLRANVELDPSPLLRAARALWTALDDEVDVPPRESGLALGQLLVGIVRSLAYEHSGATGATSRTRPRLEQLEMLIEERHRDPGFTVDSAAAELYLSRRQLYRLVPGEGIAAMLSDRRVATGCRLMLLRPELSLNDIAYQAGFRSASAMRAQFRIRLGMSPSDYRRRLDERLDRPAPAER